MATHCQTAEKSGSGECQDLGAVSSKNGGGQPQTKNLIGKSIKIYIFITHYVNSSWCHCFEPGDPIELNGIS